ncbi:ankyrin repeat-containing protein NPR4-like [Pistacia vera]|uniref:ankyrin repeat-containing protein NPR4-like n=1 Tax=Pistacia vera TaxID=55513 RepID=UPI001262CC91|nr:ankyrin repeat-containing protein NPR4-like [Pistacia vera]
MKQVADMRVKKDNILHSAGRFVPSDQILGPALQMQRELLWFKAVESFVHPSLQEQRNESNKTPRQVFTESHKNLVREGERWMKDTGSSCIIASTLIITVVFAVAFTLPGGNTNDGIPTFLSKKSFKIFIIFDALALFSSSASLLMFLGIIASRYSEEDFLEYLPNNFVMGHVTLLFSVVCMVVAFGAAICMTLAHIWIPLFSPVALVGCLTMILFSRLQFPLLVEMFSSTYRPPMF